MRLIINFIYPYIYTIYLAPSADKKTRNYGTKCSNHHPSLSTLRSKGLNRSKLKWWAIYANWSVNAMVRLTHLLSGVSQGQQTFLAFSADKLTRNYDTAFSNHHPFLSIPRLKGLSCSKMKWWAIYTNLPVNTMVRLPDPHSGDF